MTEPTPTPRERTDRAVGRLTKLLAGLAVAATALFGVAVASGDKHSPDATGKSDGAADSAYDDDAGYDDSFGLAPSQGVWSTTQAPSATSGGS